LLATSCGLTRSASRPARATEATANLVGTERLFYTGVRQLSFAGLRSGEGYFAPDGRSLVFQSEREPGNPFYQIYRLDLDTGEERRISPGTGKTTCAWIHPDGERVLLASTHLDPESSAKQAEQLRARAEGRTGRYRWDYDPSYDLFVAEPDGALTRLTRARGYDAEASFSPDGRFIAFASNRHAFEGALAPADRERLVDDPQYFIDLYLLDTQTGSIRRLTDTPG
jgi:Tol biopolymer transport system component